MITSNDIPSWVVLLSLYVSYCSLFVIAVMLKTSRGVGGKLVNLLVRVGWMILDDRIDAVEVKELFGRKG